MRCNPTLAVSSLMLGWLTVSDPCAAAAWRPQDDAVIVATLTGGARRDVEHGEGRGGADVNVALERARDYVARARAEGDPRHLGRALGLLQPWDGPQAPVDVLVLRATIHQSLHQFPLALRELDEALAREPRHAQALLTRATVLQVVGRVDAAARDCRALVQVHGGLVATTCASSAASLNGEGRQAYLMLDSALRSGGAVVSPSVRVWSHSVLGEIAERNGDGDAARRQFLAALAIDPGDRYVRAAYADWLLDHGDPAAALRLTEGAFDDDNLLLRRALALEALGAPGRQAVIKTLADRYAAARARGDALHLREEARFTLRLQRDPVNALRLAVTNWSVQKEPADARILWQAAMAAGDATQAAVARDWLQRAGVAASFLDRVPGQPAAGPVS